MGPQPTIQNGEHKQQERDLVDPKLLSELENFVMPKLKVDFPYANHPLAKAVSQYTGQWLRKHHIDTALFPNEAAYQKFLGHKIEELALKTQATATLTRVRWIANMYAIFCVLDDKIDDTPAGHSPETAVPLFIEFQLIMFWSFPKETRSLVQKILDVLDTPSQRKSTAELFDTILTRAESQPGTDYPEQVSPLGSGYRELWSQASGDSPAEWGIRFAKESQNFLLGLLQETKNRDHQTMPSVPQYIKMRRSTGCMHVVVGASTGYVANAHLPDTMYYSSTVQNMLDTSSDVTNWINDIYSLHKELKKGDVHNLVWLVSQEQKCTLTVAAERVAEMVEAACDKLHRVGAELEHQTSPQYKPAVVTLVEKCFLHVTSFLTYHRTSPRYYSPAREASESSLNSNIQIDAD